MALDTDRVRRIQDKLAPGYDRQMAFFERLLFAGGRRWVASRAEGRVLEVALGTARNLPFYPDDVELTGVELSAEMLAIARRRAEALGRAITVIQGDAQALDLPDASFDTVTCTLGLCTIPDPRRALAEAFRVLQPDGQLLLLDHVRSSSALVRLGQRALEPLTLRFEADHLLRQPLDYLVEVGFSVDQLERSKLGIVQRLRATKSELS